MAHTCPEPSSRWAVIPEDSPVSLANNSSHSKTPSADPVVTLGDLSHSTAVAWEPMVP